MNKDGPLGMLLPEIVNLKGIRSGLRGLTEKPLVALRAAPCIRPAGAAAFFAELRSTLAVVCPTVPAAERFATDAADYLPGENIMVLPDWGSYPFEAVRPDVEAIGRRSDVFRRLIKGPPALVCLAVATLLQRVPPPGDRVFEGLDLRAGQEIDLHDLAAVLVSLGYVRLPIVERSGEFAVRGSVVDVFPSQGLSPLRLDFFGNELDSIKGFDVTDQRSTDSLASATVNPCREFRLDEAAIERVTAAGGGLDQHEDFHRWLPLLHRLAPVSEYFPGSTTWFIDEPKEVLDEAARFFEEQSATLSEGYAGELPFASEDYYTRPEDLWPGLTPRVEAGLLSMSAGAIEVAGKPVKRIEADLSRLESEVKKARGAGFRTVFVLNDRGEADRLAELLTDMGFHLAPDGVPGRASLAVVRGNLGHGYLLAEAGLAVFGHLDVFPRRDYEPKIIARTRRQSLIDFSDLKHGELLVHEVHGIASFAGLTKRTVAGKTREYLMLDYAAGDRLYLPTDQLFRVSRYVGPEGVRPEITRLGSADWLRTTKKVRNSVKKLAVDLLALYAERSQQRGHEFAGDTEWQRELEAAFPYEPTVDQAAAVVEVKKDMESPKPMDRLICGDVGYGKTEVAVRAAFKAIVDGKQVMMLVPTTILAQQHYLTFKERFAPFPVKVEMLSRFLSPGGQKEVVKRVKSGVADLVIGTHGLLQKDIRFKDLGLVIVDEEQRFGVNHKEKLRRLKGHIDVLTLSATPIPRTLQMSVSGIRDLSLIETPPEGRHPVLTYIGEFQPVVIRSAIRRELARGGQVFYVHNRVETIDRVTAKVKNLVPEARVIAGHGQMSESLLEKVMLTFLAGRADVLVCTTIIESGIDIPSANTLIIENAEMFGLAQLYQLRGRVGRASQRGYAYFTYHPGRILSETAVERLRTIAELTELGSGYKIALRDLEIRGAGNLLGAEQHGHMISVGFDLYCRMLRQEIDKLTGKEEVAVPDVTIELPVNAYIPSSYIEDENLRLEAYRAVAGSVSTAELEAVKAELVDRFGRPPDAVVNLLDVADLRSKASKAGVTLIRWQQGRLVLKAEKPIAGLLSVKYPVKVKASAKELAVAIGAGENVFRFTRELFQSLQ